ncbi:MAG: hypothetical protein ACI9UJ_000973 [bacterium]
MNRNNISYFWKIAIVFCGILFYALNTSGAGFDYTPTIIQINKHKQNDTVGFNLVEGSYKLFYKYILDGTVKLWESPAKKQQITPKALQLLEKQNDLEFRSSEDLFIYEYWKLYKKDFEFQVLGFSFFSRNKQNVKVNFGYIDASEVQTLLSQVVIPTNINGSTNLSYWHAIMSKEFQFNVAKFGKVDLVKNPSLAFDLKSDIFESKKIKTNCYVITPTKEIEYFVYPGLDSNGGSFWLCNAIEAFYKNNRHIYFNETPTPSVSYLDINTALKVTRVDVSEVWIKNEQNQITYTPEKIRIYINERPMPEVSISELNDKRILIQFKPLLEFLKEKEFKYTIKRVNFEPIYGYEADEIKTALYTKDWNKIQYTPPKTLKDNRN